MVMAVDQGRALARRDPQIRRPPTGTGLYDVLDLILDKGLVIDAFVRVSLVGIELLTVDARVVIASVDTYLRYAAVAERLQLYNRGGAERLPDFIEHRAKDNRKQAALEVAEKGVEATGRMLGGERDQSSERSDKREQKEDGIGGALSRGVRNVVGKVVHGFTGSEEEGGGEQSRGHGTEQGEHRQPRPPERRSNNGGQKTKAGARR